MTTNETQEQIAFSDAVFADPDMTPDQKLHWLHICCTDYCDKLDAASAALDAALARLAAVERVVEAVRERVETEGWCIVCGGSLEHTFSSDDNPEGLEFRHRDGCALVAYDAAHTPAAEDREGDA